MYTILLLGSGGREHAIASSILKSDKCKKLYVAPGNAGTQEIAFNVKLDILDFKQVSLFCEQYHIDWIVVGPEQPLVEGIYDYFKGSKVKVLGPSKAAALLEGSKAYAKSFMESMNIPTAKYKKFSKESLVEGIQYLQSHPIPIVLKADGLAAGKGVLILNNREEAVDAFKEMLDGQFGDASSTVVVEQFLDGIEFSVFVATDGTNYCVLPEAKDYKRIGEGDTGLNTGGMGAVSPVPFYDAALKEKVSKQIILPTIAGLQHHKLDYVGFVFIGLIVVNGDPFVIEYNCRMGDPETEVVFPRITSDVVELFEAMLNGRTDEYQLTESDQTAVTIFSVSGGYPEAYQKGKVMTIPSVGEHSTYFHAGTLTLDSSVVTNGGRVISCTAFADNMRDAITLAVDGATKIAFEGKYFRTDIGQDLLPFLD